MTEGFSLTLVARSFCVIDFPSASFWAIRALDMAAPTLISHTKARGRSQLRLVEEPKGGEKRSRGGRGGPKGKLSPFKTRGERRRQTHEGETVAGGLASSSLSNAAIFWWSGPRATLLLTPLEDVSIGPPVRRAALRAPCDLTAVGRGAREPML